MKKLVALLMSLAMLLALAACGGGNAAQGTADSTPAAPAEGENAPAEGADAPAEGAALKIGAIILGDETEGYSAAHINGIKEAAARLGIADSQIVWKYQIKEDAGCSEAAEDLVGQGCNLIFSNSYGHQDYMVGVAEKYPDTTFVAVTGDYAAISGLDNFKNGFNYTFESRYVSGIVAGMKLAEITADGTLTPENHPECFDADGNVKIGYVGAYDYAEVVSGYTAYYLGVKSVFENVVMEVKYTDSWFDIDKEGAAAEALVANGCVIICQHADSTGAPSAVQKLKDNGTLCWSVGYNIDMLPSAPTAALTSATNDWSVFYGAIMQAAIDGPDEIPVNWSAGYADKAVGITELGPEVAEGTAEAVAEAEAALAAGTLHVFDTAAFTVSGDHATNVPHTTLTLDAEGHVTSALVDLSTFSGYSGPTEEAIIDGYFSESTLRSAPYFEIRIDGITEDAERVA